MLSGAAGGIRCAGGLEKGHCTERVLKGGPDSRVFVFFTTHTPDLLLPQHDVTNLGAASGPASLADTLSDIETGTLASNHETPLRLSPLSQRRLSIRLQLEGFSWCTPALTLDEAALEAITPSNPLALAVHAMNYRGQRVELQVIPKHYPLAQGLIMQTESRTVVSAVPPDGWEVLLMDWDTTLTPKDATECSRGRHRN